MNSAFRVAWACVAVLLISYVGCSRVEADSTSMGEVLALPGAKVRVRSVRAISVWAATNAVVAECWMLSLPMAYPNIGQPVEVWLKQKIAPAGITEAQCYDSPIPK